VQVLKKFYLFIFHLKFSVRQSVTVVHHSALQASILLCGKFHQVDTKTIINYSNTTKSILLCPEAGYLRLRVIVVKRVTVVMFGVNDGSKWQWWRLFLNRDQGGHSEVDEHDNSRIWRQIRSGVKREVS